MRNSVKAEPAFKRFLYQSRDFPQPLIWKYKTKFFIPNQAENIQAYLVYDNLSIFCKNFVSNLIIQLRPIALDLEITKQFLGIFRGHFP